MIPRKAETPEAQAYRDAAMARIKANCPEYETEPVFGPNGPKTYYGRVLAARRNMARERAAWDKKLGR
jgi:hypothetical protein